MDIIETFISKLANFNSLKSLRRGLLYLMPFTLIGSFILAIINLPIITYQNFMLNIFGNTWYEFSMIMHRSTIQIMTLITLITVSYSFSQDKYIVKSGKVSPIIFVITSLASFISFYGNNNMILSNNIAGFNGMFSAIIISLFTCNIFNFFYRLRFWIYRFDLVKYNGSSIIRSSFQVVIPAFLTISIFTTLKIFFDFIELDIDQLVIWRVIKNALVSSQSYLSSLITLFSTQILWFLGIHGGNFIMDSMSNTCSISNSIIESSIFNKGFYDTYVYLGGSGSTLGLMLALLFSSKDTSENKLAKFSILPGIFNINEVLIYGLPIIYNPYYLIPFILTPIVLSFNAWLFIYLEWVPPITQDFKWTTPILLSGYIATGSILGTFAQIFNLIISTFIYLPFVRMHQIHQRKNSFSILKEIVDKVQYIKESSQISIINRHDDLGHFARTLVYEIRVGLMKKSKTLHLEYQPKVNYKGEVIGAEALLRWNHPDFGYISPIIILSLCEEAGLTIDLGKWIINEAFSELKEWHDQGYNTLSLSVNLDPYQLREDQSLVQSLDSYIKQLNIDSKYIELEITENSSIDSSKSTKSQLKKIKELGINLSIDDFGMGHSSLNYICDYHANIVKIDMSLISSIVDDKHRQQIVKSIITLCKEINVLTVAEGVENNDQLEILNKLGCNYFQGFYFSRSLTSSQFIKYVQQHNIANNK